MLASSDARRMRGETSLPHNPKMEMLIEQMKANRVSAMENLLLLDPQLQMQTFGQPWTVDHSQRKQSMPNASSKTKERMQKFEKLMQPGPNFAAYG